MDADSPTPQPTPPPGPPSPPPAPPQPLWIAPALAPPPRRSGRGWIIALLVALLLVVLGLSMLLRLATALQTASFDGGQQVREHYFSHQRTAPYKVAILTIQGVILEDKGFIRNQIERAMKDDDLQAVVLRINSPGGSVSASDQLYHRLATLARERKIPLVVSMGGIAASGGYYLAMAVGDAPDAVFAERTTWTGSIGVIIPHYNIQGLLEEKLGVKQDSIASGPLKQMGTITRPMTDEEKKLFQGLVDESFSQFKKVVAAGRPNLSEEDIKKLATGQIYTANQALEHKLIDRIGYLEDAVARAVELSGRSPEEVAVVQYKPELSLLERMTDNRSQASGLDVQALLELATPRAYYLVTWLPPLAGELPPTP